MPKQYCWKKGFAFSLSNCPIIIRVNEDLAATMYGYVTIGHFEMFECVTFICLQLDHPTWMVLKQAIKKNGPSIRLKN